jgi:hypothetical protein
MELSSLAQAVIRLTSDNLIDNNKILSLLSNAEKYLTRPSSHGIGWTETTAFRTYLSSLCSCTYRIWRFVACVLRGFSKVSIMYPTTHSLLDSHLPDWVVCDSLIHPRLVPEDLIVSYVQMVMANLVNITLSNSGDDELLCHESLDTSSNHSSEHLIEVTTSQDAIHRYCEYLAQHISNKLDQDRSVLVIHIAYVYIRRFTKATSVLITLDNAHSIIHTVLELAFGTLCKTRCFPYLCCVIAAPLSDQVKQSVVSNISDPRVFSDEELSKAKSALEPVLFDCLL